MTVLPRDDANAIDMTQSANDLDVEAFAGSLIPDDDSVSIIIDYAKDQPVVQSLRASDLTGQLRRPVDRIIVRNSGLADNHPEVRNAVREMQHCGYRVEVEL